MSFVRFWIIILIRSSYHSMRHWTSKNCFLALLYGAWSLSGTFFFSWRHSCTKFVSVLPSRLVPSCFLCLVRVYHRSCLSVQSSTSVSGCLDRFVNVNLKTASKWLASLVVFARSYSDIRTEQNATLTCYHRMYCLSRRKIFFCPFQHNCTVRLHNFFLFTWDIFFSPLLRQVFVACTGGCVFEFKINSPVYELTTFYVLSGLRAFDIITYPNKDTCEVVSKAVRIRDTCTAFHNAGSTKVVRIHSFHDTLTR